MLLGKGDELFHIRENGVYASLHGGDGIALSLKSNTLSHDGSEFFNGDTGCSSTVCSCQVAAKDKDFVVFKAPDELWRDTVSEFTHLVVVFGGAVFHAAVCFAFFSRHGGSGVKTY